MSGRLPPLRVTDIPDPLDIHVTANKPAEAPAPRKDSPVARPKAKTPIAEDLSERAAGKEPGTNERDKHRKTVTIRVYEKQWSELEAVMSELADKGFKTDRSELVGVLLEQLPSLKQLPGLIRAHRIEWMD